MAVQVVPGRDLPVEQHAISAVRDRGEHEGLVHREKLVLVGDRSEQALGQGGT
jgi:hypothetical protein